MARSSRTGARHEINYEHYVSHGIKKTRAACVCGAMKTPFRFDVLRAQEDGRDHMDNLPEKGKPPKREEDSKWAESLQL